MSFTVCWTGKEKTFSDKDIAIRFQDSLPEGSDLWFGESTLLRSRVKYPNGTFETTVYNYDGEGGEYTLPQ